MTSVSSFLILEKDGERRAQCAGSRLERGDQARGGRISVSVWKDTGVRLTGSASTVMPSNTGAGTIAADRGGVAGQWLRGQLQPFAQHPPEGSVVAGLRGFALAASTIIALAQASPIPAMDM